MSDLTWEQGDGKGLRAGDIYLVDKKEGKIAKLPIQYLPTKTHDFKAEKALAISIGKRFLDELKERHIMYFIKTDTLTGRPLPDSRLSYHSDYGDEHFYYDYAEYEERVLFMYTFFGEYEEYRNGTPTIAGTYMTDSKYDV